MNLGGLTPYRGARRPKHRGHKPANVLNARQRAVKVVRMYEALIENGWTFKFKAEGLSPRGFTYAAEGATAEEAFLKAFGQWRSELYAAPPKVPAVAAKPAVPRPPVEAPEVLASPNPKQHPRRRLKLSLIDAWLKTPRPYKTRLKPPAADPKKNQARLRIRLYMRAYRDRKRLEQDQPLVVV